MKLHIVTMHRNGMDKGHNYVLGAYKSATQAWSRGEAEASYRSGKYEPRVSPVLLGKDHHEPRRFTVTLRYRPSFLARLGLQRWLNWYESKSWDRLGDDL